MFICSLIISNHIDLYNNQMRHNNLQICIDLYSVSSVGIQKTSFYTVFFVIGQRQNQIYQKRSPSSLSAINFHESVTLKLTSEDLSDAGNEAKIVIYAIQNYGRKKLFGRAVFIIEQGAKKEMKIKLESCEDKNAFVEFRYQFLKSQSKVSSLNNSRSNILLNYVSRRLQKEENECQNRVKSGQKMRMNNFNVQNFNAIQKKHPNTQGSVNLNKYKTEDVLKNINQQSINKLETSDDLNNVKYQIKDSFKQVNEKKGLPQEITEKEKKYPIFQTFNKNNEQSQDKKKRKGGNVLAFIADDIKKIKQMKQNKQLNSIQIWKSNQSELKIQSKTVHIIYLNANNFTNISPVPSQPNTDRTDSNASFITHLNMQSQIAQQIQNQEQKRQKKQKLNVKRKITETYQTRIDPFKIMDANQQVERWQNDENLANTVHGVINNIKGRLGYMKIARLASLNQVINSTKNKARDLIHANEQLKVYQQQLLRKIELAEQRFKQKETKSRKQLENLTEKFNKISADLQNKNKSDSAYLKKISQIENQMNIYLKQIKRLQGKLERKTKQIETLRQMLIVSEEQQDKKIPVEKKPSIVYELPSNIVKRDLSSVQLFVGNPQKRQQFPLVKMQRIKSESNMNYLKVISKKSIDPELESYLYGFRSDVRSKSPKLNIKANEMKEKQQLPKQQIKIRQKRLIKKKDSDYLIQI